jgi:hypothetical protein
MHLLKHRTPAIPQTAEQKLRNAADKTADYVFVVAGYDLAALQDLSESSLTTDSLMTVGIAPAPCLACTRFLIQRLESTAPWVFSLATARAPPDLYRRAAIANALRHCTFAGGRGGNIRFQAVRLLPTSRCATATSRAYRIGDGRCRLWALLTARTIACGDARAVP